MVTRHYENENISHVPRQSILLRMSGCGLVPTQPRPLDCEPEAAWGSRCWLVHAEPHVVNGRGLAHCIRPSTDRDTDWNTHTHTHLLNTWAWWFIKEFNHMSMWVEPPHLDPWGRCEEGAPLFRGREGEVEEGEEEAGRGEEPLQPSVSTWTPSDRHTNRTDGRQGRHFSKFWHSHFPYLTKKATNEQQNIHVLVDLWVTSYRLLGFDVFRVLMCQ